MSVRGNTSYPFQGFGRGLNLKSKPDAVDPAEAIDCLDVTFTDRGAIEERTGYKRLTASALTNRVASLEPFYQSSGTKQLLAGCGTRLEALSSAGAIVDSETGLTSAIWDFARFGKPREELAYAGNGSDTLRKWNGTEWTAPTAVVDGVGAKAMPRAAALCVDPTSNRLVCGNFTTAEGGPGGASSSQSHVFWSEPGNPEGYESTAFVQFTPGDGERIMAVIAWREFVFIFKETKIFTVAGNQVDGEGKPIFNIRPIETGIGLASSRAVCVHRTGVYFMSRQGVYRTTGQEPELVSSPIEPIWTGNASPFFTGGTLAQGSIAECAMGTHQDRIYLAYPTSAANNRVLVFDPLFEWWTLFDIPASCVASFRPENNPELVFGYASGEKYVGRHNNELTGDEGFPVEWSWRSGWFDLGNPDVKTLRSAKVWGTGTVQMSIDHDFQIQSEVPVELDMVGGSGSIFGGEGTFGGEGIFGDLTQDLLPAPYRRAVRGTTFSARYSGSDIAGGASIHRADFHLREIRIPSTTVA